MGTDGPRFGDPVMDRFAPEIPDGRADADGRRERRVSVQPPEAISRCEGRARSGFDDAGVLPEGAETDAIQDAV